MMSVNEEGEAPAAIDVASAPRGVKRPADDEATTAAAAAAAATAIPTTVATAAPSEQVEATALPADATAVNLRAASGADRAPPDAGIKIGDRIQVQWLLAAAADDDDEEDVDEGDEHRELALAPDADDVAEAASSATAAAGEERVPTDADPDVGPTTETWWACKVIATEGIHELVYGLLKSPCFSKLIGSLGKGDEYVTHC